MLQSKIDKMIKPQKNNTGNRFGNNHATLKAIKISINYGRCKKCVVNARFE
jgi:hypothetical protein